MIFWGLISKFEGFEIVYLMTVSLSEGFRNRIYWKVVLPSSALKIGRTISSYSSAISFSSYQISPSFSLMKAMEPCSSSGFSGENMSS